jgi:hypothetical protein
MTSNLELKHANVASQNKPLKLKTGCNGWGIFAQNFESQILKDVMLEGIKEDIVCLPVHDTVAVQQQHQGWAKDVMLETWQAHLGDVASKVKVVTLPAAKYDTLRF